jgi:hypothetical protein
MKSSGKPNSPNISSISCEFCSIFCLNTALQVKLKDLGLHIIVFLDSWDSQPLEAREIFTDRGILDSTNECGVRLAGADHSIYPVDKRNIKK